MYIFCVGVLCMYVRIQKIYTHRCIDISVYVWYILVRLQFTCYITYEARGKKLHAKFTSMNECKLITIFRVDGLWIEDTPIILDYACLLGIFLILIPYADTLRGSLWSSYGTDFIQWLQICYPWSKSIEVWLAGK